MRIKAGVTGVFMAVTALQGMARAEEPMMSLWPVESEEQKMSLPHPLICSAPAPELPKTVKPAPRHRVRPNV